MLDTSQFAVLCGHGHYPIAKGIIDAVNNSNAGDQNTNRLTFGDLRGDGFPDGEASLKILNYPALKNRHLILFQSIHSETTKGGDLLEQFLTMAWAAKRQYGVLSITAVVPFLRFRRQDHPEKKHEIHRGRMIADLMAACGIDRIILCDIHSEQILDNFRQAGIPQVHNVDPSRAFADHLRVWVQKAEMENRRFLIHAPDGGSIPRALTLARELGVDVSVTLKDRTNPREIELKKDPGALKALSEKYGCDLILAADQSLNGCSLGLRDDELAGGNTARKNGDYLRHELGATELFLCATHPVCISDWMENVIDQPVFDRIFLGDTVPRGYPKSTGGAVTTVSMARVIADQLLIVLHGIE